MEPTVQGPPIEAAAPPAITVNGLSKGQARRLAALERVIETGMQTFVKVGRALQEIRAEKLYRAQYGTFDDYLAARWHFTHQRAQQLMSAARTVARTAEVTGIEIPTERVSRTVEKITREQGEEAAHAALTAAAKAGKITPQAVEAAGAANGPVSKDATQVYVDMLRGYLRAIVKLPAPEGVDPAVAGRRGELAKALTKCLNEFFAD